MAKARTWPLPTHGESLIIFFCLSVYFFSPLFPSFLDECPFSCDQCNGALPLYLVILFALGLDSMAFPHRFFFELMIKSMIEHLARTGSQDSLRKMRFSHQYCDDIQNLTSSITNDIIAHNIKDVRDTRVRMPSLTSPMPLSFMVMHFNLIHLFHT